jgi:hypothetical protein
MVLTDAHARHPHRFGTTCAPRILELPNYVISADEKPSIQARDRCHATAPAGKGRAMRVNHDYRRGGALAYLAATTCITGGCSDAATPPPASQRLPRWSTTS